ncbi:MAG TPA: hypothetical protein VFW23_02575, partial [Tepidisphaeraceae bacterium]|nr:hypothetical protein [Tepidisphaeraceae bacterium]
MIDEHRKSLSAKNRPGVSKVEVDEAIVGSSVTFVYKSRFHAGILRNHVSSPGPGRRICRLMWELLW